MYARISATTTRTRSRRPTSRPRARNPPFKEEWPMKKFLKYGSFAVMSAALFASGAFAADTMVQHNQENAKAPFASSVHVPAGYDTYYISGSAGKGTDTAAQTAATLDSLKAQLAKLGLTF